MTLSLRSRHALQRGSILVNAAIILSLAVILLIGTELGYQFYIKREFQKAVDLAALAGAQNLTGTNCAPATAAALSNANDGTSRNLPVGFSLAGGDVACGTWAANATGSPDKFTASSSGMNAVRVQLTRSVPPVIAFSIGAQTISVRAVAARALPRASLNIRSTLVNVDSAKSALLNSLFSGLLGGAVTLDAVGWNGLVNTNVQLLSMLDQLALRLNIAAGQYDQVLNTQTSVGNLIGAMASALTASSGGSPSGTASIAIAALDALTAVANAASAQPLISLSDLLKVQTGTSTAGLDLGLQAFQLIEGVIQAANSKNALVASVPITIGGLEVTVITKIVEPPQFSSIGDPQLARASPLGSDRIYVRTAAARTLISVNLGSSGQLLENLVSGLSAALNTLTSAVSSILGSVINLSAPTGCTVLAVNCKSDPKPVATTPIALPLPARIDVNIDIASAESYVTDFDCANTSNKTLTANATTSIATVRVGKMGNTLDEVKTNVFSSLTSAPVVKPVPIIDIGTVQARYSCPLVALGICVGPSTEYLQPDGTWKAGATGMSTATRKAFGGGGLGISATPTPTTNGSSPSLNFQSTVSGQLLEIEDKTNTQTFLSLNSNATAASSLAANLTGIKLNFYAPDSSTGLLGAIFSTADAAVSAVVSLVQPLITSLMSSIADPIVAFLLNALGIDLATTQVGGRMTCNKGVELVY